MIDELFFEGFEKKAWGISIGPDAEMIKQIDRLQDAVQAMGKTTTKELEEVIKRTTDDVFKRVNDVQSPKRMIRTGLALGAGLAGGALVGRYLTKTVGKTIPGINKSEEFSDQTANPQYGVNR